MMDLLYVAATIVFFAIMAGYVRFCAALRSTQWIDGREP